jgi:hypothetical protein
MANLQFPSVPPTPEGGLAGFYRGTQFNYGIADAERQFRDADLANQRLTNLYQNELLDNPMKEQERLSKIAEAGYNSELINSGAKRQGFDADLAGKEASTAGQKLLNQKAEITLASDALVQAASLPKIHLTSNWDAITGDLRKKGVKIDGPFSEENYQKLREQAQASTQTVAHLHALEMEEQKRIARLQEASIQGNYQLEGRRISAAASAENTAALVAGRGTNPTGNAYEVAVKKAQAKVNSGEPVTASDILAIKATMQKDDATVDSTLVKKVEGDLIRANTRKGDIEGIAAQVGMSESDLKPFKRPDGSYNTTALAKELVDRSKAATTTFEAWKSTGGGKMTQSEWEKVAKESPVAAAAIKERGVVIPEDARTAPKSKPNQPASTLPVATEDKEVLARLRKNKANDKYSDQQLLDAYKIEAAKRTATTPSPTVTLAPTEQMGPPAALAPFDPNITNAFKKFSYQDTGVD